MMNPAMNMNKKPPSKEEELLKEQADLEKGAVMKATLQPGLGDESPADGDLVFITYSFHSTKPDGTPDIEHQQLPCHPRPFILGKGEFRALRGMELGIMGMSKGELASFKIRPEYAFRHKTCTMQLPTDISIDPSKPVQVEVRLLDIIPGPGVSPSGYKAPVFKRTMVPGDGWETPRQPFEVQVSIATRWLAFPSSSSSQSNDVNTCILSQGPEICTPITLLDCELGDGKLPSGVEEAFCDMKLGEEALVWCPVSAGINGSAVPNPMLLDSNEDDIVGDSTTFYDTEEYTGEKWLEYTLKLHDFTQVRDLAGDGTAVKRIKKKGTGEFPADCPLEDTSVTFHLRVRKSGTEDWVCDTRRKSDGLGDPITADTGTGDLPDAIDSGVRLMLRNEVAIVTAEWKRAYGDRPDRDEGEVPKGLKKGSDVDFEIELVDFVPERNWNEMTVDDMLVKGGGWKDQGNVLFKKGRYSFAKTKYTKGLRFVGKQLDFDTEEQANTASALKLALLLNIAACAQKLQEYREAITWCDRALEQDPDCAKAFFRRGIAQYHLNEYEPAALDFETAKELDPDNNVEVDKEIKRMRTKEKAGIAKQRAQMKGFLG